MSKLFKKVLPVAAAFIPGVGPWASAALGAGLGALGGGGLKGALLGGAGGYLGGAVPGGGTLGGKLAGSVLSRGAETVGRGISGALSGAATGGLKGALLGGVTGGVGANASDIIGGAKSALGVNGSLSAEDYLNAPATMSRGTSQTLTGVGNYTTPQVNSMVMGGGQSTYSGSANDSEDLLSAPAAVSPETNDILKSTDNMYSTPGLRSMATPFSESTQGDDSMLTKNKLSDVLSGGYNVYNTNSQEEELLKGLRSAQEMFDPYYRAGTGALSTLQQRMANGFNPGDLTQDPGYQFQLEQGNKNLNRSLGAQGSLFSGRALQEAQKFGQGLADQTYKDAYNRWMMENQNYANLANQGYNAAGQLGDYATTYGTTKATADAQRGNYITGTLSSLLRGEGAYGRVPTGYYDEQGNPIYM